LLVPLNALPDEDERLAEGLALDWNVLVGAAERLAVGDAAGRLPPAVPVEGRAPAFAPPAWPEPQPRASRVLAEPPAPLVRIRFWSGCHFCAGCWLGLAPPVALPGLFTLAFRELFTLMLL